MPVPRLYGVETEYGYTHIPAEDPGLPRPDLLRLIQKLAGKLQPCARAADGRGWFLASGSRFYLDWTDIADKPEFATTECSDPLLLIRHVQQGDAFMEELEQAVERKLGGDMIFTKTNVDYLSGNTWGSHESYLIKRGFDVTAGLVPFLCSRIVFTGSGGFNNAAPGLEFVLSTRAPHIERITGSDSQHSRPIIHSRDESHARSADQRIHLIVGEGLHSETAMLLRMATTALAVGLIEAGLNPGKEVSLKNPVAALKKFGTDPHCEATVKTGSGNSLRALDIQRHYLKLAGDHLASLPVWAESVCQLWSEVLDALESGEEQTSGLRLDWVIRRQLYTNFLRSRGLTWEDVAAQEAQPAWTSIFAQLFELDTKFGRIGRKGMFHVLDERECLAHRICAAGFPQEPVRTRAAVRGAAIHEAFERGKGDSIVAEWSFLYDSRDNLELNLINPFENNAEWGVRPIEARGVDERGWIRRLRASR